METFKEYVKIEMDLIKKHHEQSLKIYESVLKNFALNTDGGKSDIYLYNEMMCHYHKLGLDSISGLINIYIKRPEE